MKASRVIGVILMIVGVVAFAARVFAGPLGIPTSLQPVLFWVGIGGVVVGIILDSIGGGGIYVVLRLVGATNGPGD